MLRVLSAIFLIASLLGSRPALAQEDKAAIAEQALRNAETYDAEAKKALALGEHEEAIRLWKKAFDEVARPSFLFNIGRAYLDLQKCQTAIRFFENFINATQSPQEQAQAATLIDETKRTCKEALPSPPKSEGPGSDPRLPPSGPSSKLVPPMPQNQGAVSEINLMPYAWSSWALGLGAAASGAALIAIHTPKSRDGELLPRYRLTQTPGIAVVSVGGALLLVGTILWLVDGGPKKAHEEAVTPSMEITRLTPLKPR